MPVTNQISALVYLIPLLLIWGIYVGLRKKREAEIRQIHSAAVASGMTEPASLHPVINANRCVGCASCAAACPENKVLGVVDGKARLVNPSYCIGHGACQKACPMDAITLVFGTERRGVDIPMVNPNFETNVPGVFIAGELGGMGLIRNAVEQGRQAMESILKLDGVGRGDHLDVVIVGAGPAGFSASLLALEKKLRYVTLEQESLGGTVAHFPRGKIVMTAPVNLPMVGKVKFTQTTKETLLEFWRGVETQTGIQINYGERVDSIDRTDQGFDVQTSRGSYRTRAVLLAIGRRGVPRKLGVPGEELSKVVYRLIDPEQYRGQKVLVVGGGDSALEAATSIADQPGTEVSVSYRSGAFSRAKEKNRKKVEAAEAAGRLRVLLKSNVNTITEDRVQIDLEGEILELENDAVFVNAGGILPTPFLEKTGIVVETKHGTA